MSSTIDEMVELSENQHEAKQHRKFEQSNVSPQIIM